MNFETISSTVCPIGSITPEAENRIYHHLGAISELRMILTRARSMRRLGVKDDVYVILRQALEAGELPPPLYDSPLYRAASAWWKELPAQYCASWARKDCKRPHDEDGVWCVPLEPEPWATDCDGLRYFVITVPELPRPATSLEISDKKGELVVNWITRRRVTAAQSGCVPADARPPSRMPRPKKPPCFNPFFARPSSR